MSTKDFYYRWFLVSVGSVAGRLIPDSLRLLCGSVSVGRERKLEIFARQKRGGGVDFFF